MLYRLLRRSLFLLVFALLAGAAGAAEKNTAARAADDPTTWPPEVRSEYEAIRAMPAEPRDGVLMMLHKLAAHGPAARPAIAALAADRRLPEPHRAWSGILAASYVRYDAKALRSMSETHRNPFARREAIDLLADIGGSSNRMFLEALARKDANVREYIEKAVARAPAIEPIAEDDLRLLSAILLDPIERKKVAAVLLVDRQRGKPNLDAPLERLTTLSIADTNAQIYAALALAKIHAKDVTALKALTARDKNRFLRYEAMQELAQSGPAGEAVLRELAAAPEEPLKALIEKLLTR